MDLVLVGVRGCVLRPIGHSPVTLFSLSVSIKDRSLHMTLGKSQIIVPSAYLGMGVGKACCSLVVDRALSDRLMGRGGGGGPCTTLSPGLRMWGLGV